MNRVRTGVSLLACAVASIPILTACRVSQPFRGPGYDRDRGVVHPTSGQHVLVAITQGDIEFGKRG